MDPFLAKVRRYLEAIPYALRTGYMPTNDRVNPDFPDENFVNHFKVYKFAARFAKGKRVLDVGSGTGYGSDYLAGLPNPSLESIIRRRQSAFQRSGIPVPTSESWTPINSNSPTRVSISSFPQRTLSICTDNRPISASCGVCSHPTALP
jgi:hypothetical protein